MNNNYFMPACGCGCCSEDNEYYYLRDDCPTRADHYREIHKRGYYNVTYERVSLDPDIDVAMYWKNPVAYKK